MNIDIEKLKKQTQEAIEKGKNLAALKESQRLARIAAEKAADEATAQRVLLSIPNLCEEAANKGLSYLTVYSESTYFRSMYENGGWRTTITSGPGLIIIDECKKLGFDVEVRYADDGCGEKSWAKIIISW